MVPKNRFHLIVALLSAVLAAGVMLVLSPIGLAEPRMPVVVKNTKSKSSLLKQQIKTSKSTIHFWNNRGKWALHRQHRKCWQVYGEQRRKVCRKSRQSLRYHTHQLKLASSKLAKLQLPEGEGYLPPDQAMNLGRRMAALSGWKGQQWNCLRLLWGPYESGWRVHATNPTSGAYGIPQAYPGSKMASAGENWRVSAYTQIKWGLGYIRGRFGSPCSALAFRRANGWY